MKTAVIGARNTPANTPAIPTSTYSTLSEVERP
jgi:hypothetical protein